MADSLGFFHLVGLRHEERAHEAKRSFPWRFKGIDEQADQFTTLRGNVTRTVMALANLPGGGRVVIGVAEEGGILSPVGLEEDHLLGWTTDDVMDHVNKYASPEVQLRVDHVGDDEDRA